MQRLITLVVVLTVFGYHCVDGSSCTTYSTCQTTDYTVSTCSNIKVCDCVNSSYVAIRTGCALKLDKPVISADSGRSNQVVNGARFTLTCNLVDAAKYEWYQGTTKLSTNTGTYSETANATTVGSFTCKGISADDVLTSESSDAFVVEMLGGTGGLTSSKIQPTISVSTTQAISGSGIILSCNNIPMGTALTDVSYKVDSTTANSPVVLSGTNAGKDISCTIANGPDYTFSSGTSAIGKFPTIITNIKSVAVTWNSQIVTEIDKRASTYLTLTCTTTPGLTYLGASPTIVYAWQKDGSAITGETSADHVVYVSRSTAGAYSCTATLSGQTAVSSSNKVNVTYRTDGLTFSATSPIKGGRVFLTCGDIRYDGVTYLWYKDNIRIDRQYDRKLQIDNLDTTDDGSYRCIIFFKGFELERSSRSITIQATIDKPTVTVGGCGSRLGENGDYWLSCDTISETIGMTYEWTAKGVVSTTVTNKYYSLPAVSLSNNGVYTCKAKFGSLTSDPSDAYTVEITNPGKLCYHDNTCMAAKTGYSGKCDLNDRCQCADGYSQKGEICSGGVVIASSLIMLMFSYVITRLL